MCVCVCLQSVGAVGDLIQAIDATESTNHELFYQCSLAPTRLAGRNPLILQQTRTLLERAIDMQPNSAIYLCELGYHQVLTGNISDAVKSYRKAMALDETSVKALHGIISCQLQSNQLDDAAQQLDFLNEIQSSLGETVELGYLSALLAARRKMQSKSVFGALETPLKSHLQNTRTIAVGEEYFETLCPDLLLQVVLLYLEYGPTDPPAEGDAAPPVMKKCSIVLEEITRVAPGLLEAVYLLARIKYLSGDIDGAKSSAQYCLAQDNTHADALLLMASINVYQGNISAASQSLEIGLSYNFEVRDSPTYHLINAKIQQAEGNIEGSIKTLAKAWKLPGVKRALAPGTKGKKIVTSAERVSVYLALAQAFYKAGQSHEAAKIMQDAQSEFSGTSEEMRIQIANSDLAIGRGDVEGALTLLTEVTPAHSYYVQAKEKMAKIYLEYRKDKEKYAACYKELVDQNPNPHTQLLLGDAYIAIHDPENAIIVYEKALRESGSRDSVLAQKIGMALVKTHDYKKAMAYYEAAVKQGAMGSMLRADLAELYLKLGEDNKCEKTLLAALKHESSTDLEVMLADVRYRMLMSRMHSQFARPMQAIQELEQARSMQGEVLRRSKIERPEILQQQKELAADICMGMTEHHRKQRDISRATELYSEAISYDEGNASATIKLSQLYLETGQLEDAQQQLTVLLNNDKKNNDATMMMAEVMFRKHESDSAIFHFTQLLDREPEHYEALARLIDLMRRAGELPSADKFLESAKKASLSASTEPGLNYCKGLYHRYLGETNQALSCFIRASKDSDFGVRALYNMVAIYLNPDDETLGGEIFEKQKRDPNTSEDCLQSAQDAFVELARRKESGEKRYEIYKNYLLMSDKSSRGNIEKAIKAFTEMVVADKDNVPAMLGVARAYMFQKQPSKARYQLKNILKMNWRSEYADEFEGGWLLLADIHIGSGKHDLAQEPLKKCVTQNKSCSKAWEYMGHIWEKDQAYVNAVEFYEYAWTYSNQKNMGIGYIAVSSFTDFASGIVLPIAFLFLCWFSSRLLLWCHFPAGPLTHSLCLIFLRTLPVSVGISVAAVVSRH